MGSRTALVQVLSNPETEVGERLISSLKKLSRNGRGLWMWGAILSPK